MIEFQTLDHSLGWTGLWFLFSKEKNKSKDLKQTAVHSNSERAETKTRSRSSLFEACRSFYLNTSKVHAFFLLSTENCETDFIISMLKPGEKSQQLSISKT